MHVSLLSWLKFAKKNFARHIRIILASSLVEQKIKFTQVASTVT